MSRRIEQLREDYLHWLESQLRSEHDNSSKSYWDLVNLMFDMPFVWVIDMDENRMVDGMDLRIEFINEFRAPRTAMNNLAPCSFLEVLIGLSRRLAFMAGGDAPGWAWQLLGNLELHRLSDPLTRSKQHKALEIMQVVMARKYLPDGTGGFFPLAWPDEDQTQIELWNQLNAYARELHPEH